MSKANQQGQMASHSELHASWQLAVCAAVEASFGPRKEYERKSRIALECERQYQESKANLES